MNCSLKVQHRMEECPTIKWPNKFYAVGVCIGGVTLSGYRLPKHELCPDKVHQFMLSCWNENPDDRSSFSQVSWNVSLTNQDFVDHRVMERKTDCSKRIDVLCY